MSALPRNACCAAGEVGHSGSCLLPTAQMQRAMEAMTNQESEQPAHVDHPLDGYTYEGCPGCHAGPPLTTEEHDALPYDKPKPSEQPVAPVTEARREFERLYWPPGPAPEYAESRRVALDYLDAIEAEAQLQTADAQLVRLREALDRAANAYHEAAHRRSFAECIQPTCIEWRALYVSTAEDNKEAGQCWFCKGTFPLDALIAGYDTWDEQRWACLACNERMQPKPEAVARIREEAVQPWRAFIESVAAMPWGREWSLSERAAFQQNARALLTENKPKSEAGEVG